MMPTIFPTNASGSSIRCTPPHENRVLMESVTAGDTIPGVPDGYPAATAASERGDPGSA
jgi:hypothetical protein